jgi:hypothetical protein
MASTPLPARSRRRLPLLGLLTAAVLLLLATPLLALAAPTLVITPAKVAREQRAVMTGSGYQPGAVLRIVITDGHRRENVTTLKADAAGRIHWVFTSGPGADVGADTFLVIGRNGRELARARLIVTNAPPVGPRVSISPASGPVGTRFTLTGRRFPPHAAMLYGAKVGNRVVLLGRVTTSAHGTFTTHWRSTALGPGKYVLGVASNPRSEPLTLQPFTITRR